MARGAGAGAARRAGAGADTGAGWGRRWCADLLGLVCVLGLGGARRELGEVAVVVGLGEGRSAHCESDTAGWWCGDTGGVRVAEGKQLAFIFW